MLIKRTPLEVGPKDGGQRGDRTLREWEGKVEGRVDTLRKDLVFRLVL